MGEIDAEDYQGLTKQQIEKLGEEVEKHPIMNPKKKAKMMGLKGEIDRNAKTLTIARDWLQTDLYTTTSHALERIAPKLEAGSHVSVEVVRKDFVLGLLSRLQQQIQEINIYKWLEEHKYPKESVLRLILEEWKETVLAFLDGAKTEGETK